MSPRHGGLDWAGLGRRLGLGYVVAVPLCTLVLTISLQRTGPAGLAQLTRGEQPPGALALLAWLGLPIILLALLSRTVRPVQWYLAGSLLVWVGATSLVSLIHGDGWEARNIQFSVVVVALALGAAMAPSISLRRSLFALGWIMGWGSVVAGAVGLLCGWPEVAPSGDPRYGDWLRSLGIHLPGVTWLNGLAPGRVYLGMVLALLLPYTVRSLLGPRPSRWMWLLPVGMLLALGWSFSRTGMVACTIGLVAAALPFERIAHRWQAAVVFGSFWGVALAPLLSSYRLTSGAVGDPTTIWRFDIWHTYVADPRFWLPFGIGSGEPVPSGADHAHQQLVQTIVVGGWVGVAGMVTFTWLAACVTTRVVLLDRSASLAVFFAAAGLFQFDILTNAPSHWSVNSALVVLVVVVLGAAGRENLSAEELRRVPAAAGR